MTTDGPGWPSSRLGGKAAVVVGAGSGIGAATAETLAGYGARVVVADVVVAAAEEVAGRLRQSGFEVVACHVDVRDDDSVRRLVDEAVREFGRIDVWHNNAAVLGPQSTERDGRLHELELDVWDLTMAVNLRGVMLGCKHVLPVMIDGGGGSIINTSSVLGIAGARDRTAYACSKAGVEALTRSVARQYGRHGIRCNTLAPGMAVTSRTESRGEERIQAHIAAQSLPVRGTPRHQAEVVAFLASDESAFITGQTLVVDAGLLGNYPIDRPIVGGTR
jgi:NAD(P)-dependent dehydrogenase (short-subunit alcohol dehydrogenase family)